MVEVEVTFDYEAEQIDELSIKVGDIIKNVKMVEGGWWEGELNGKPGMFPDNFVKVIDKSKEKEEHTSKKETGKRGTSVKELASKLKEVPIGTPPAPKNKEVVSVKKKKAKVLFDYDPENEDELKIETGDIVEITKQEEEGWWEGMLNGKKGMFPSNFVEEMDDTETEKTEKIPEEKPKETQEAPKKKIMGVGLGNIFAGGPISLRTSSGVKKEKEEVKAPPQEDAPAVVKREKPALHASTVPEFSASNYINSSVNVEPNESNQQEQFTDIVSETPASNDSWLNIVYGSTDTFDGDMSTAGQEDVSNSYVLVNHEGETMYELSHLSEFEVLSGEKFATYVNLEGKDREENKENIAMETWSYKRSLNSSLPFKQTAILSENNKNNNNHMHAEGTDLLEEELYKLESHFSDATETNGASACARQSESYITFCNEKEWLEEGKLSEIKTNEDARKNEEKDVIFMEMDFRKTKSKKQKDSLFKRVMNMDFFRKKYKGIHIPPKSADEGIRKENGNSVAVMKEKDASGKHGRSNESFQSKRIPLKELNASDFRLIDSDLSQSIEVSVDSSIDGKSEIEKAKQRNKDNTEEQKSNMDKNTSVGENHSKTQHSSNNSQPKTRREVEEEILEQMELAMCSENFPNSQESSSLQGSGNDPVFEEVSLDVNKDSYLGFLQRTGRLSSFIKMIASRYHLFDAKDGKWKPYNVEMNQSQLASSEVPKTNLCEYNTESNYLASQNPEEGYRKDIVSQYNICSRDGQEKRRQGQECGNHSLESKCKKVKHIVSSGSPNYRVLPPDTVKETIQNYDHVSVNQLVSECLDKAFQNLSIIKTIKNKNDKTDLTNLSDVDLSCESQLEDSLYSAYSALEDMDYTTSVASVNTDQSHAISYSTTETVSDDSRVQTGEFPIYKFVPYYQPDCFLDISGQSGELSSVFEPDQTPIIVSYKTVPCRQTCSKYLRDHKGGHQGPWVSPAQTKQTVKSEITHRKRKSLERGLTTSGTPNLSGFTDNNTIKTGKGFSGRLGTRTQMEDQLNEASLNSSCLMSKDNLMQKEDRGTSPVKELFYGVVGLEDEESPTLNTTGLNITTAKIEGKPRYSSSPIKPVDYEFTKEQQHQSQIKMETVSTQTDDLPQPGFALKNLSTLHSTNFKPHFVKNYTEPRKKRSFWKRLFRKKEKNPVVLLSYRKKSDNSDLTSHVEKNVTEDQNVLSGVTRDFHREEVNLSHDRCSTKSHLVDANILMTKEDIVHQESDPVLECINTVETFFSFEETELEMSKIETVSDIRGDQFQRNGPSCLSSVTSDPVKDKLEITDHSKSVDKALVDGYTNDGDNKEVEIDVCSGCDCEYYSVADVKNEVQGLEISNIPSNRGKCNRVVVNQTYEHMSAEEDYEDDQCDDISNQGNTSSVSEANIEDSSDASLESPNISASVSKDILQKLTLATTPKNGDNEGTPNLSNFLEEALKPIDDLLLNTSSSETEGSGDDVTPTAPKHCNHVVRESNEKYPSFTYLSESVQDLFRQNAKEQEGNQSCSKSTITQNSADTQENLHNLSKMDSSTEKENITAGESFEFIDTERFPFTFAVENEKEQLPSFMYTTVRDLEGADTSYGRGLYEHIFETESETEQINTGDTHIQDRSSLLSDGKILHELPESGFINCHQTDNIEVNTENKSFPSLYRSDGVDDLSNPSSVNDSFTDDLPIQSCHRILTTCQDTAREQVDCVINSLSLQDELNAALQEDNSYSFPELENQMVLEEEDPLHVPYSCCGDDLNESISV